MIGYRAKGGASMVRESEIRGRTLRGVFVGETLRTFQLNDQYTFHNDVRKVFPNQMALISYRK